MGRPNIAKPTMCRPVVRNDSAPLVRGRVRDGPPGAVEDRQFGAGATPPARHGDAS
jgi:hypothetical protein